MSRSLTHHLFRPEVERQGVVALHDADRALDAVVDEHERPGLFPVPPHLEVLGRADRLAAEGRRRFLAPALCVWMCVCVGVRVGVRVVPSILGVILLLSRRHGRHPNRGWSHRRKGVNTLFFHCSANLRCLYVRKICNPYSTSLNNSWKYWWRCLYRIFMALLYMMWFVVLGEKSAQQ